MHKKWQQELRSMKLSTAQKNKMKHAIIQPAQPSKKHARLVFPAFISLALLFFIWGPTAPASFSTAANTIVFETLTLRIIIWLTLAQLLLVVAYIMGILCIRHVKRWDNRPTVQKLRNLFSTSSGNALGTMTLLAVFAFMWGITIALPHTLVAEAFFTGSGLLFAMTTLTYFTRDNFQPSCPHCETRYTRKQLIKMSFRLEPKCPSCDQRMTTAPHFSGAYAWVPSIMVLQYTSLYYVYVVFLFVTIGAFIMFYIIPYSTRYIEIGKDDLPPPLW